MELKYCRQLQNGNYVTGRRNFFQEYIVSVPFCKDETKMKSRRGCTQSQTAALKAISLWLASTVVQMQSIVLSHDGRLRFPQYHTFHIASYQYMIFPNCKIWTMRLSLKVVLGEDNNETNGQVISTQYLLKK